MQNFRAAIFYLFAFIFSWQVSSAQVSSVPPPVQFQQINIYKSSIYDSLILNFMKIHHIEGCEFAIYDTTNKNSIFSEAYGFADEKGTHVSLNDQFRFASLSKIFTAIGILKLTEQKKFRLNDTVFGPRGLLSEYLSTDYKEFRDTGYSAITVNMLLHHTGGWDRNISNDYALNKPSEIANIAGISTPPPAKTIIDYMLRNVYLDHAPGTAFAYSNFGYLILGRIIEKFDPSHSYENYIITNILKPLGITAMHLGLSKPDYDDKNNLEVHYFDYPGAPYSIDCYDTTSKNKVPAPYGAFDMGAMDSYGGWVGKASDIVNILVSLPKLLTPESITAMTSSTLSTINYGMGIEWQINSKDTFFYHNGGLAGTSTEFLKTSKFACAILFNSRPNDKIGCTDCSECALSNKIISCKDFSDCLRDLLKKIVNNKSK